MMAVSIGPDRQIVISEQGHLEFIGKLVEITHSNDEAGETITITATKRHPVKTPQPTSGYEYTRP